MHEHDNILRRAGHLESGEKNLKKNFITDKKLRDEEVQKIIEKFSEPSLQDFSADSDDDYEMLGDENDSLSSNDENDIRNHNTKSVEGHSAFVSIKTVEESTGIAEENAEVGESTNNVRKRQKNEKLWIQNHRKLMRNSGQQYLTKHVYNLTLYDLVTKEGYCNFWMEINGERSSDEVGSILLKHLENTTYYSRARHLVFRLLWWTKSNQVIN
ncbi:uncharacterized protein LOC129609788 [Condylostylus longicornis]|uniref:uncharacterized protein LOC129609788 n=1 Tax=Condylostylus longicornis TaxID=2530218 RepID=UPI00244E0256|nr:uncharacterized protein LOC129609788 [Condylostylus longicornis]